MTRRKAEKKTSDKKRGGKEYFTGDRKEFLEDEGKSAYQAAIDSRKQNLFYDKITVDYIAKFGHLTMTPSEEPVDETRSAEKVAEQVAEDAAEKYQALRQVSCYSKNSNHIFS